MGSGEDGGDSGGESGVFALGDGRAFAMVQGRKGSAEERLAGDSNEEGLAEFA